MRVPRLPILAGIFICLRLATCEQLLASAFDPPIILSVGNEPLGIGIGDIDSDGRQDLIVTAHDDGTLSIFLNSGAAGRLSFAGGIRVNTGKHPQGIAVADLDDDGKPEIVVANAAGSSVTVFHNASTVGAVHLDRKDYSANTPHRVAIGDLDGDGLLDIVFTENASVRIAVLLRSPEPGTLTFTRAVNLRTASYPNSIAVADVNGDGKLDIVAPITDTDALSVYLNSRTGGSLSFLPPLDFEVLDTPDEVAISDLNNDNLPEIVVANRLSDRVSLFFNSSEQAEVRLTRTDFFSGIGPSGVAFGDLDGDGTPDVIATSIEDSLTILHIENSEHGVEITPALTLQTGQRPALVVTGDLDGDGAADIAVSNEDDTTAFVFHNSSGGFLSFPLLGYGPYTAPVSAILDHSIAQQYNCGETHVRDDGCFPEPPRQCASGSDLKACRMGGDGVVRSFTGKEGRSQYLKNSECRAQCLVSTRNSCGGAFTACGYPRKDSMPFTSEDLGGINYMGTDQEQVFLQYDGHSGYDYPSEAGRAILAPANGRLVHSGLVDPVNGDALSFNTFKIIHPARDGYIYETWVLHARRGSVVDEGEVEAGQVVAQVGCTGLEQHGCPYHLHFELRKYPVGGDPQSDSEIIDPYEKHLWKLP